MNTVNAVVESLESNLSDMVTDLVRKNAKTMTLHDLFRLMSEDERAAHLVDMSLGELSGLSLDKRTKEGRAAAEALGKARKPRKAKDESAVDTRSVEGREAFRQAVLAAVTNASEKVSLRDVQEVTGGSTIQVRTALNFHRDAGAIKTEGNTRNTVYFVGE